MKHEVMVSVIVLTYNHEKYIRQALDSILMQKVDFEYEILIGDDCSTDGTMDIILQYAADYPHLIRPFIYSENKGASKNLYYLSQKANGKYLAYCEGDDYWGNCFKLQKQVSFLEKNSQYMGTTHQCICVDEHGVSLDKKLNWISQKVDFSIQNFNGYILPGQLASLVHRNFFRDKKHDFSILYRAHEMISDRTLFLIVLCYGNIYQMQVVMSYYRIHTEKDAKNATTMLFAKNDSVNLMQYKLSEKLEQYSKKEFGIVLNLRLFKATQLLKWMIKKLLRIK